MTETKIFPLDIVFALDYRTLNETLFRAKLDVSFSESGINNVASIELLEGSVIVALQIRSEENFETLYYLVIGGNFNVTYGSGNATATYTAVLATTSTTLSTVTTVDPARAGSASGAPQSAAIAAPVTVIVVMATVLALIVVKRQRRRRASSVSHGPAATGNMMTSLKSPASSDEAPRRFSAISGAFVPGIAPAGTGQRGNCDDDPDYYSALTLVRDENNSMLMPQTRRTIFADELVGATYGRGADNAGAIYGREATDGGEVYGNERATNSPGAVYGLRADSTGSCVSEQDTLSREGDSIYGQELMLRRPEFAHHMQQKQLRRQCDANADVDICGSPGYGIVTGEDSGTSGSDDDDDAAITEHSASNAVLPTGSESLARRQTTVVSTPDPLDRFVRVSDNHDILDGGLPKHSATSEQQSMPEHRDASKQVQTISEADYMALPTPITETMPADATYEFATTETHTENAFEEPNYEFAVKMQRADTEGGDCSDDADVDDFYKVATTSQHGGKVSAGVSINRLTVSHPSTKPRIPALSIESATALSQQFASVGKANKRVRQKGKTLPAPAACDVPRDAPQNTLKGRLSRKMSRMRPSRRQVQSITQDIGSDFSVTIVPPPRKGSLMARLTDSVPHINEDNACSPRTSSRRRSKESDMSFARATDVEDWENIQNFLASVATSPPPSPPSIDQEIVLEHSDSDEEFACHTSKN